MNDQADRLATGFLHNEVPVERLREFLNNEIPPTERERVATRMQVQIKIDNILNKMSEGDRAGIPPRSWWVAVGSGTHGRDRARAFYNYWRNLEMPEKRRSMERIAQGLSVAGVGVAFWNRDFALEFDRLKSEEDNHYGYGFGATKETLPSFKDEDMKK